MNKGLDHNKRTGALLFSSLTAAALGLMSLNTNVVKADSNSGTQDTAQSFNKNDNDSRVETRVANNTVSQANNQVVTTNNANTTAPEGNANGTTDNADETQNGSVESPQGNNKDSNSQTSAGNDQPETDITKNENKISTKTIKTGKWGNADLSYDSDTNVLTVSGSTDKENPTIIDKNAGMLALFFSPTGRGPEVAKVKKVIFVGHFKIVGEVKSIFMRLSGLTAIEGLQNVDTSEATTMYCWFYQCYSLESLDLSQFNTSQVTSMDSMFDGCKSLKKLDLKNFNTSKVTNMTCMFAGCESLEELNVTKFDTSNVTDMSYMFNHCASLTTIDVRNFNTSNVTNMASMFSMYYSGASDTGSVFGWDSSLVSLDLSNFDTSKVTDMSLMFFKCTKLKDLNISKFNTSQVTTMNSMFQACNKLTSLDLSNFDTSKVTDMYGMFRDTNSLISLDVSRFDTTNVTNMGQMFYLYADPKVDGEYPQLSNLRTLDISNFNISDKTYCGYMLKGQAGLLVLKLGDKLGDKVNKFSQMDLDTPGIWLNVGSGSLQNPKPTGHWSSEDLRKNWNGKKETYVRETTITAHYQDEKGKTLAPDESFTGTYGTPYEAKVKEIPGYVLTAMPKNAKGLIGENVDDIMFIYQKPTKPTDNGNGKTPVKAADVTVHYEDENGNQIAPNVILSGNVGDGYQTETKAISGYTLKTRPNNAAGFFTSQPRDVVYVYTKNDQSAKEPEKEPNDNDQSAKEPGKESKDNSHNPNANAKPNKKVTYKTNKKAAKEKKSTGKQNNAREQPGKSTGVSKKTRTLAQTGSDWKSQVGMLLSGASALVLSLLGVGIKRKRKE